MKARIDADAKGKWVREAAETYAKKSTKYQVSSTKN
jgi:hypothetical protein